MTDDLLIPVGLLRNLLVVCENHGLDRTTFLDRYGISERQLNISAARLPLSKYATACIDILDRINVPALGVEVAERIVLPSYGLIGYASSASENLEKTLEMYNTYAHVMGNYIRSRFRLEGDDCIMSIDTRAIDVWPKLMRYEVEQECALWFNMKRNWLVPTDWFESVHFSFSAERCEEIYSDFFCCPVHYNASGNYFLFKSEHLKTPFMGANDDVFRMALEQCERELEQMPESMAVTAEIRQLLSLYVTRYPSFEQVAAEMRMSPATLRRRLDSEGTSYKQILKQLRIELAIRYLLETRMSIAEIAYLTGYSEPKSFNRAFRAITGMAPSQYRKQKAPVDK